ncbi:MAG: hypothetical protein ACPG5P_06195 [Saprospiraceae bacterium]
MEKQGINSKYQKLTSFILFFALSVCLISCGGSTSSGSDLDLGGKQAGYYLLDEELVSQSNVSGIIKNEAGIIKYTILANDGSAGFFVNIHVPIGTDIEGEHELKGQNKLVVNQVKDKLLNVFSTDFCKQATGKVTIEKFNEKTLEISGYFSSNVCSGGQFGTLGIINIENGAFRNVKLMQL